MCALPLAPAAGPDSACCPRPTCAPQITSTNPANPLRNLRVIMPGFEATHQRQPFHPWFLKSLERFSVRLHLHLHLHWPLLPARPPVRTTPAQPSTSHQRCQHQALDATNTTARRCCASWSGA
jgi:hypothetical protein